MDNSYEDNKEWTGGGQAPSHYQALYMAAKGHSTTDPERWPFQQSQSRLLSKIFSSEWPAPYVVLGGSGIPHTSDEYYK